MRWLAALLFGVVLTGQVQAQLSGGSAGAGPSAGPAASGAAQGATAQGAPTAIPAIVNTNPWGTGVNPAIPGRGLQMATEPSLPAGATRSVEVRALAERNEFQDFVFSSLGRDLPLFGHSLFQNPPSTFAPLDRVPVTPDYILGPGDEIVISAWGQVDIDYRTVVDRNGSIAIPRVGSINVTGLRYQDLEGHLKRSISRVFTNFELRVTLGQLRSIQIFVVGQAQRPGAYTISSLSTLINALFAAGGPSAKGSMRAIQVRRADRLLVEFDLYDLLLKGDKSKDMNLLPGDVIYIPPIGKLAAISGSVTTPAIFELRNRATLGELVELAGGFTVTASGQKATVERIAERRTRRVEDFPLDKAGLEKTIQDGDFVKVFPLSPRFENAVTVRGNVAATARHPWISGMRVRDIIPDRAALIVPDYWIKRNQAVSVHDPSKDDGVRSNGVGAGPSQGQERLRNQVIRTLAEVNWDYAVVERLNTRDLTTQLIPFNLGKAVIEGDPTQNIVLVPGDVITVFSKDDIQVPQAKRSALVKLEGEIAVAGVYQARPGETLRQLVARVGGLTPSAYLFGAEFERESTRALQQKRLDEAIDRFDQDMQRNLTNRASISREEATAAQSMALSQTALITRLRKVRATGRIVLEVPTNSNQIKDLPDLTLEDGDRFYVPAWPSTVAVAGAVYNPNAFIYRPEKRLSDYLSQSGGATKDGDSSNVYLIRADGSVASKRQSGFVFSRFERERMMPGDTLVVPEEVDRYRWTRDLRDWSQIMYQFALGVAGLKILRN